MKLRILTITALLCLATAAGAQDLKPVKDKETKLYGYQDKDKNWVIPPSYQSAKKFNSGFAVVEKTGLKGLIDATGRWVIPPQYDDIGKFDKSGLCEVTIKEGKVRRRGLADQSGRFVIPPECVAVNVLRNESLIAAERDVEVPRVGLKPMWGLYDMQGNEVFEPQFTASPSFYNGRGTARSAWNGLKGIISSDGQTLLPFNNLAISSRYGGYEVLTADFVHEVWDSRMQKTEEFPFQGYVFPYDPAGDPVRAAAWHTGAIGHRFHRNNLKEVRLDNNRRIRGAACYDLRIDWHYDRFVRFEPVVDEEKHPGAMLEPNSGLYYTVKAVLCESDGTPLGDVSRWGWFEADCAEGIIYNAEGESLWMAMRDINCPAIPSFSVDLTDYRPINNADVISGLGLRSYELDRMYNPLNAADRYTEIIEGENLGITGMQDRPAPDLRSRRTLEDAMRLPIFRQPFGMGQVVNCKTRLTDAGLDIELADRLVCPVIDKFEDPSYEMKGVEEIYWGPNNARKVWLSLESVRRDPKCTIDDIYNTDSYFVIVLNLYEEDGRFLRTLGVAPALDFAADGMYVFESLNLALLARRNDRVEREMPKRNRWDSDDFWGTGEERPYRKMSIPGVKRLPGTLSSLKEAGESIKSHRSSQEHDPDHGRGGNYGNDRGGNVEKPGGQQPQERTPSPAGGKRRGNQKPAANE
ncbi:MAG: WG repeat-containing protein [Bacteroidales bacterium]|nr:WG repeat-containing protein [Bacteroidales bacterium]